MNRITEPTQKLPEEALKVSILKELIGDIIGLAVLVLLFFLDHYFDWLNWIGIVLWLLAAAAVLSSGIGYLASVFAYRNLRYEADQDYLKLRTGAWFQKNKLVPMTKIQSVETTQGPLQRKYDLQAVNVETMASSHKIPAIPKEQAEVLRNQIAFYAKIEEEDPI